MFRKRAERRGRVQARREQETRQGAGNGHGTAKRSAGLASGWALSALTPSCRHSEVTGRRPPIRPGASSEAPRVTGGASPASGPITQLTRGRGGARARRPPGPRRRWHCAAPASGCSPVGAVAGASLLHRSPGQAKKAVAAPCRADRSQQARGTSPGHRAGSPCRLWLSRRVPLMATLDRASAGERTQPDTTGRSGEDS